VQSDHLKERGVDGLIATACKGFTGHHNLLLREVDGDQQAKERERRQDWPNNSAYERSEAVPSLLPAGD
jgi:hypothetical protein